MKLSKRSVFMRVSAAAGVVMAVYGTARGADGTWTGAQDAMWTNSANWSATPYAGYNTNEKATFDGAGNGHTTLDMTGLYSVGSITFDTANVAAYTLGAGAVNSQTLVRGGSGTYYLTASAGHSQLFNAALQLGGSNVGGSYFFRNESATETITFAGNVTSGAGSTAGVKTLGCYGAGSLIFSGNLSKGTATALVLTNALAGTLTLSGASTVQTLHLGGSGATVTDLGGGTLGLSNNGGLVLNALDDGAINGSGKISLSSTLAASGENVVVAGGKTLTVDTELAGTAGSTLGKGGAGTCRLTAANSYPGAAAVNNGLLILSGASGALAAVSGLSVAAGATLSVENSGAANLANRLNDAAPLTLNGGTFAFAHGDAEADYAETLGALNVAAAGSVVSVSQAGAGYTSSVTFAALARGAGGTVDFIGTGIGEDNRNRIFIAGLADGLIGLWATVNGTAPAAYDSARGVYASTASPAEIAARGPDSVIPDDAFAEVRITSAGDTGPITLAGDPVSHVGLLRQDTNEHAIVRTAAKTLLASTLSVSAGQGPLTIGEAVGDGTLSALSAGGQLAFVNDSSSALTVNAAIADNTSASSIGKSGAGDVVLNGAITYTGPTAIDNGTLTFGAHAVTQTVAGVISGNGALGKSGTNILHLFNANTYSGTTFINQGIVRVNRSASLGASASGTVIADGATLDVGCTPDVGGTVAANTLNMQPEPITVQGAGLYGQGAIVNNSTGSQYNAIGKVSLSGDATFSTRSRWDIRDGTLAMNDHAVTKLGADIFSLSSVEVTPGGAGTAAFGITNGVFRLQRTTQLNGGAMNTVTLSSGTQINFFDLATPQPWSLISEEGTSYFIDSSSATTQNFWGGPITLKGAATLASSGAFYGGFAGVVSGAGSLLKTNDHTFSITGTNNTYTGATRISGGTLNVTSLRNLGEACSLGQPTSVENGTIKIYASGTTVRLIYLGAGDTCDRIIDLAGTNGQAVLNHSGTGLLKLNGFSASGLGNRTLYLQGSTSGVGEIACMITNGLVSGTVGINKSGTGAWVLSGNNRYSGSTAVDGGTLTFTGANVLSGSTTVNAGTLAYAGSNVLSGSTAVNGGALTYAGTNILSGSLVANSGFVTISGTNGYGSAGLVVGGTNRNATLTLAAGASVGCGGDLRIGNPGGSGALYINGASVLNTASSGDQNFVFGRDFAYGYLNMTGGSVTAGRFQMAGVNNPVSAARGLARISGGTLTFSDYLLFSRNPGCESVLTMDGGTLNHSGAGNNLCLAFAGGRAELNMTGGTLNNSGRSVTVLQNNGAGATGVVNLCSGMLTTVSFANYFSGVAFLNFCGGMIKPSTASTVFIPSTMTGVYSYGAFGAYAGGAVIDSSGNAITIPAAIRAPTGQGVSAIPLANQGSGYIGEPYVSIEGGGGVGATAVANMADDGTGSNTYKVASVTITCPGVNYASAPTVLFKGGGTNIVMAGAGAVALAANGSGGLTKSGAGVLTLSGANTYTGTTTVAGGTLKLGLAGALPPNTQVTLAGGVLDLGGLAVTNAVNGSGTVSNGTALAVISPAGDGAVGSNALTLASATLRGTYRVDVTPAGGCDLLAVQGALDLSKFALQIVDPGQLDRQRTYTILTAAGGGVTGRFSSVDLPGSLWHVVYLPNGTVRLVYAVGTVIRIL